MAVSGSQELDDLTECSICAEVFTDPRLLPCVHTFCLRCLEGLCYGKLPGSEAVCPLCRYKFMIPSGGVRGLPKNFIIEKLKAMKISFGNSHPPSSEEFTSEVQCPEDHLKNRVTLPCESIGSGTYLENHVTTNSSSCSRHSNKNLELYCIQCNDAICAVCFIESHKSHECLDIDRVAKDLESQMAFNVQWMASFSEKCRAVLKELTRVSLDIVGCTTKNEDISNLDQKVANYKALSQNRFPMMRQFSAVGSKIECKLSVSESLQMHTEQVSRNGNSESIVKWAEYLQNKTEEFMRWDTVHDGLNLTESG